MNWLVIACGGKRTDDVAMACFVSVDDAKRYANQQANQLGISTAVIKLRHDPIVNVDGGAEIYSFNVA